MTSKSKYQRRQARKERKSKAAAKAKAEAAEPKKTAVIALDDSTLTLPSINLEGTEDLTDNEVLLMRMLSYKRPGGGKTEAAWIREFIIKPLEAAEFVVHEDWMGNLYVHVGDPAEHKTLFSSHTDTVHYTEGTQSLEYDPLIGFLGLKKPEQKKTAVVNDYKKPGKVSHWKSVWNAATNKYDQKQVEEPTPGNTAMVPYEDDYYYSGFGYKSTNDYYSRDCLGADDGTGVFIMVQMILDNVKGTYVFHREEESGGQGSNHIAMTQQDCKHKRNKSTKGKWKSQDPLGVNDVYAHELDLTLYDRAIAFDRKGTTDIITDQFGPCASRDFAAHLAARLNELMEMPYAGKNSWKGCHGVFTDTANYVDYIPECTNLSVGYYDQHTANETQNVPFAMKLLEACKKLDWYVLPVAREIGTKTYQQVWDDWGDADTNRGYATDYSHQTDYISPYEVLPEEGFRTIDEALDTVMDYPEAIAELLFDWYGEHTIGIDATTEDDETEAPDPVG